MSQIKHSKLKNTGILFELLVRQVTSDILKGLSEEESKALEIIREYFRKDSVLSEELTLYKTLVEEKCNTESEANYLIDAVIRKREKLPNKKLAKQKYNLVGSIKEHYDFDNFFKARIKKYTEFASVYKLFELHTNDEYDNANPKSVVRSRYTLVESLTGSSQQTQKRDHKRINESLESYKNQTKDMRLLTYKLMVDNFNAKYSKKLSDEQKEILREYINHAKDINALKESIDEKIPNLRRQLKTSLKVLRESNDYDKTIKIKINEAVKLLDDIQESKTIDDNQITALLLFHELLKEIKS